MGNNLELNKEFIKEKHSKLGVITFIIFISILVPFIAMLSTRFGIIKLEPDIAKVVSGFFTYWIIFVPIVSLILSIIDLKRQFRCRVLPKITLILSSIIIAIGILLMLLSTISDISRIL